MTQPLDLDAIEQRANATTPGPWWNDSHEIYAGEHDIPAMCTWIGETCNVDLADNGGANGTFIAAARQDVPGLLAEVRRLRAELAQVRGLHAYDHHLAYHQGEPRDNHVNCGREGCQSSNELYPPARTTQES